mgnify:FL=1
MQKKKEAFSAPLFTLIFAIERLIDHTALAALEIVAIELAVCLSIFLVTKHKVEYVFFARPVTAYTVVLVPLIIGTNSVF